MSHTATSSRVTIIDVARAAGVSYATVSRVLNDDPYVKLETRERVSAALDRMGYVANRQARSLRTGRSQMIGLLVRDLGTGYVGEIVAGIDAEIAGTDREMLLFTTHQQAREPEYVATIVGGMADGLLLVLPFDVEPYGELLAQRRFPYVLIDYEGSAVGPAVTCPTTPARATSSPSWTGYPRACFTVCTLNSGRNGATLKRRSIGPTLINGSRSG